jgi:hypothetical protein
MSAIYDAFVNSLTGNLFGAAISLFYLIAKLTIRLIVHRLVRQPYDKWGTFAWFSVDVAVLTLALCISSRVTERLNFTYEEAAWWYLLLGFSIMISSLCYGDFLRQKKKLKKTFPLKNWRLATCLTVDWFFGLAFFLPTINALKG